MWSRSRHLFPLTAVISLLMSAIMNDLVRLTRSIFKNNKNLCITSHHTHASNLSQRLIVCLIIDFDYSNVLSVTG